MIVKKTILAAVFLLFGCAMFSIQAETFEESDKELMAKLMAIIFKCFKDADWGTCGEMLKTSYDITQPKYKQCTCQMACVGEDLEMINSKGEPELGKFQEYVDKIKHSEIKGQLKQIYDKCNTIRGSEKCDLSEKFTACAFKESPKLKEYAIMLLDTLTKMKPK